MLENETSEKSWDDDWQSKINAARKSFEDRGIVITEWSEENGFNSKNVYAVLAGRNKGYRGEAHLICVALGLKTIPNSKI